MRRDDDFGLRRSVLPVVTVAIALVAGCSSSPGDEQGVRRSHLEGAADAASSDTPPAPGAPIPVQYLPEQDGVKYLGVQDPEAHRQQAEQFAAQRAERATPEYRISWLAAQSHVVTYVTVTQLVGKAVYTASGTTVMTTVSFELGQRLTGTLQAPAAVDIRGGEADGITVVDTSAPRLTADREYLAFLAIDPTNKWHLVAALPSVNGEVTVRGKSLDQGVVSSLMSQGTISSGGAP